MRPKEEHPPRFGEEVERRLNDDKLLQLYEAALSALSGHLDFTKALLTRKPELASLLDSFKCSPLHLAPAEGHTEIVKALLRANKEVCLVADEEGRIPLHLAAMRGKVEIIQELVDAQHDSIRQKLNGSTVLHLCVQFNQLESLKQLVSLVDENQLLDYTDHGGNSILHLAVMPRQLETITFLVSVPEIKAKINVLNKMGLNALDLLNHYPRDFKSLEIGEILIKAGSRSTPSQSQLGPLAVGGRPKWRHCSVDYEKCVAGTAVQAYVNPKEYLLLTIVAIISFIASLSVVLLAISGLPLKNKLCTWLMTIAMIIAITFVLLTLAGAIVVVTPDHILSTIAEALVVTEIIWIALVGIVAVFATIRLLFWLFSLLSKLIGFLRKMLSRPTRNQALIC
ncbi:ankyrin repeat and sterile alpha motif domain-containing protein 1B-like [Durio zibethinus]|uniref:Ankyrin repeat and sterile alpha motif domain-containing protein 1B-like n=1 Tax=Durio zibethinus TaxID=66656 RepID=A0A6P5X5V0_DURZI|nr:ankyrin repeat and sterile alpha motif domain-containing protein 1B-like [Durio zibethinus]